MVYFCNYGLRNVADSRENTSVSNQLQAKIMDKKECPARDGVNFATGEWTFFVFAGSCSSTIANFLFSYYSCPY